MPILKKSSRASASPAAVDNTECIYVPLAAPVPEAVTPRRAGLTAEEQEKYNSLLEHFNSIGELPVSSKADEKATAPLSDEEKAWITRECLLRYLRATKWKLADTCKRVEGTLVWRREFGVYDKLTAEYISPENETGKQLVMGYDLARRPCLYLFPSRQNTKGPERQVQHLVYSLERVIDMMPSGQDTLALLIDFKDATSSKNPSVGTGRQVLHILQTHYPERLGKALVINIPWFVWTFLKIIYPFIDPLTREKLVFSEPLDKYVPAEQLDVEFGGKVRFPYDHAKYWPALESMCKAKRELYMRRWRDLGGPIGAPEEILRAETDEQPPAEATEPAAPAAPADADAAPPADSYVAKMAALSEGSDVDAVDAKLGDLAVADK
ncbi:CRAL-TRIO domain-containing protein [Dipodascopsis tothii]|uniref:CRAL-TRIO domain-containing protein n=1 Tax=Dipodascopsis tothii TaxID=44089 RepID=UPI0034CDEA8E